MTIARTPDRQATATLYAHPLLGGVRLPSRADPHTSTISGIC